MTFLYAASFDLRDPRHQLGTVTFSSEGQADFTIDLRTDVTANSADGALTHLHVFNHYDISTVRGRDRFLSLEARHRVTDRKFAEAMSDAMRSAGSAAGWSSSSSLACIFDDDAVSYRFQYDDIYSAISFSNTTTRAFFGFADDFDGVADEVDAVYTPNFIIIPILSAVAMEGSDGFEYEPGGISTATLSASGMPFGFGRTTPPIYRDWTQLAETRARAFRDFATAAHPFTHQSLFESQRGVHPFLVRDGFGDGLDYVMRLRPDKCMWNRGMCRRARGEMDDAQFDIKYQAQVLGDLSGGG